MDERTEFAAAVSRVHAVYTTALIVGLILTLILGQQIREHQATLKRLGREARGYVRQESVLNTQLQFARARNAEFFKRAAKTNPELRSIDPQLAVRVAREDSARKERLAELDKLSSRIDGLIDATAKKDVPSANAEDRSAEAREEENAAQIIVRGQVPIAPRKPTREESAKAIAIAMTNLQDYHAAVIEYRKTYASASALRDRVEEHTVEARKVRQSKQSLPTPFGQFEVSPRIGLIGVLLALIGAQLYFIAVATRARRIATTFKSRNPAEVITRQPAPAWLATFRRSDLSQTLAWQDDRHTRLAASIAIHATWIVLAGYLTFEIFRWRAAGDVLLAPTLLIEALAIGAFLLGVSVMIAFLTDARPSLPQTLPTNVSRRRFVAISGAWLGTAMALVAFGKWRRKRKEDRGKQVTIQDLGDVQRSLVVSKRTRTAHHWDLCKQHLPKELERDPRMLPTDALHSGCKIAILSQLAREANTVDDWKRPLNIAIALSPLSIHLYDELIAKSLTKFYFDGAARAGSADEIKKQELETARIRKSVISTARAALSRGIETATQELEVASLRMSVTRKRRQKRRAHIDVTHIERVLIQLKLRQEKLEKQLENQRQQEEAKKRSKKNPTPILPGQELPI